jgi:hypothetical protein
MKRQIMAIMTKKEFADKINELVGGDMFAGGNDRNPTNNSEIETGPVVKTYDDDSDYEKGQATTSDRVFGRYRQNIPWFAVYTFGGNRTGLPVFGLSEDNKKLTKQNIEEIIEDLVKKGKDNDISDKTKDNFKDLLKTIEKMDLTKKQVEDLLDKLKDKKSDNKKSI